MKNKFICCLFIAFLTGCSNVKTVDANYIGVQSALITQNTKIMIAEIPTHGAIGDAMVIAAGGGGNARQLRNSLLLLSDNGGGSVAVTSLNPELSKVVIEGALKNNNGPYNNVWLIYAGAQKYSDNLKSIVEAAGISYGFIDITK